MVMRGLCADDLAGPVTGQALAYLRDMFAAGPLRIGSTMAGRAGEGVGEPELVAASGAALADDLLGAIQ